MPVFPDPYPLAQEEYLSSICRTLHLRLIINRLLYLHSSGNVMEATDSGYHGSIEDSSEDLLDRLVTTCHAVVASLNRRNMRSRSILSFITGYSAMSAGLGLLYWLSTRTNQGSQTANAETEVCYNEVAVVVELLSVVARQFPPFHNYKTTLLKFQTQIKEIRKLPGGAAGFQAASPDSLSTDTFSSWSGGPEFLYAFANHVSSTIVSLLEPNTS